MTLEYVAIVLNQELAPCESDYGLILNQIRQSFCQALLQIELARI